MTSPYIKIFSILLVLGMIGLSGLIILSHTTNSACPMTSLLGNSCASDGSIITSTMHYLTGMQSLSNSVLVSFVLLFISVISFTFILKEPKLLNFSYFKQNKIFSLFSISDIGKWLTLIHRKNLPSHNVCVLAS